jgi:hypothetical protein
VVMDVDHARRGSPALPDPLRGRILGRAVLLVVIVVVALLE